MASSQEKELLKRVMYVNSLQKYHVKFKSDLATILQRLEWTPQHILDQQSPKVTCSYCPDHKMPAESLKKHEEICYLVREKGYTIEELEKEAPSSRFFYENSKVMTITLEKDVINGILDRHHRRTGRFEFKSPTTGDRDVPQTLAASKTDFSPPERLVLYDSVVKLAKESKRMAVMPEDKLLTVDLEALVKESGNSEADEPSSEAEKWAAIRDYKRRRQSYRAKNVHITKKAYTEIIREVIHNQVDLLQNILKSDDKLETEKKAHKRKSESKNETTSDLKNRDRESPERKKRDADKSDSRTRDQKNPDDRRRERDRSSPDSRKRDRRSPESRNRRSRRESPRRNRRESPRRNRRESPRRSRRESPDQKRRSRSSSYSRKKDHKSPDARRREKEDDEVRRGSTKLYVAEPWKKYDGENLDGVGAGSYSKSRDHKKRSSDYIDEKRSHGDTQEFQMFQAKVDTIVDALVNFH